MHPNPHGNGKETIAFFKDQFGLDPKESAALMGVHTLGHPQEFNSKFRHYSWTGQQQMGHSIISTTVSLLIPLATTDESNETSNYEGNQNQRLWTKSIHIHWG